MSYERPPLKQPFTLSEYEAYYMESDEPTLPGLSPEPSHTPTPLADAFLEDLYPSSRVDHEMDVVNYMTSTLERNFPELYKEVCPLCRHVGQGSGVYHSTECTFAQPNAYLYRTVKIVNDQLFEKSVAEYHKPNCPQCNQGVLEKLNCFNYVQCSFCDWIGDPRVQEP